MDKTSGVNAQSVRVEKSFDGLVQFARWLESIAAGNSTVKLTEAQWEAVVSNQRKMADYAVLLLTELDDDVALPHLEPEEVRQRLGLVIRSIQVLRIGLNATKEGLQVFERQASKRGQQAANTRHSKPGGSHEKTQAMRQLWASGIYASKDLCAEQECAALEMSFSTARKALRNMPKSG